MSRELVLLYRSIGREILARLIRWKAWGAWSHQTAYGDDLQKEFPWRGGVQSPQPQIYACSLAEGLAGTPRNSATACGTFALGPPAGAPQISSKIRWKGSGTFAPPSNMAGAAMSSILQIKSRTA